MAHLPRHDLGAVIGPPIALRTEIHQIAQQAPVVARFSTRRRRLRARLRRLVQSSSSGWSPARCSSGRAAWNSSAWPIRTSRSRASPSARPNSRSPPRRRRASPASRYGAPMLRAERRRRVATRILWMARGSLSRAPGSAASSASRWAATMWRVAVAIELVGRMGRGGFGAAGVAAPAPSTAPTRSRKARSSLENGWGAAGDRAPAASGAWRDRSGGRQRRARFPAHRLAAGRRGREGHIIEAPLGHLALALAYARDIAHLIQAHEIDQRLVAHDRHRQLARFAARPACGVEALHRDLQFVARVCRAVLLAAQSLERQQQATVHLAQPQGPLLVIEAPVRRVQIAVMRLLHRQFIPPVWPQPIRLLQTRECSAIRDDKLRFRLHCGILLLRLLLRVHPTVVAQVLAVLLGQGREGNIISGSLFTRSSSVAWASYGRRPSGGWMQGIAAVRVAARAPCRIVPQVAFQHIVDDDSSRIASSSIGNSVSTRWSRLRVHQVGAAHQQFVLAAVAEVVEAAVLQEAPDDADHADILADAGHAGPQAAHAAHDQVDLHAGLRRAIERLDEWPGRPARSS